MGAGSLMVAASRRFAFTTCLSVEYSFGWFGASKWKETP
jgi:hypothetical protein